MTETKFSDEYLLKKAVELLGKIYPGALWNSCMYQDVIGADPTFHCCDWNEVVEETISLSIDLSLAKGDNHEFDIPDCLRATEIKKP